MGIVVALQRKDTLQNLVLREKDQEAFMLRGLLGLYINKIEGDFLFFKLFKVNRLKKH